MSDIAQREWRDVPDLLHQLAELQKAELLKKTSH